MSIERKCDWCSTVMDKETQSYSFPIVENNQLEIRVKYGDICIYCLRRELTELVEQWEEEDIHPYIMETLNG